jgi:ribulose-phosphate 3-epimerase
VLEETNLILVMSVNPGSAARASSRVSSARSSGSGAPSTPLAAQVELEVDGGVTPEIARRCVEAGATALVAGSAAFKGGATQYAANIAALRGG